MFEETKTITAEKIPSNMPKLLAQELADRIHNRDMGHISIFITKELYQYEITRLLFGLALMTSVIIVLPRDQVIFGQELLIQKISGLITLILSVREMYHLRGVAINLTYYYLQVFAIEKILTSYKKMAK